MADEYYTAYFIGRDQRIQRRVNFMAPNDERARQVARELVEGHTIELWHRARMIARFDPSR